MSLQLIRSNLFQQILHSEVKNILDKPLYVDAVKIFNYFNRKFNHQNVRYASSGDSKPVSLSFMEFEKNTPVTKSDPAIIIMHGLFGSKMNWATLSRLIHRRVNRKVYSVDARNHGNSPHTKEHNYPLMTEDLLLFLKEHDLKKVTLIGHSMGGRTMMYFALKHPELVENLIIVDVSPIGVNRGLLLMTDVIKVLQEFDFDNIKGMKNVYEARKKAVHSLTEKLKDVRVASYLVTNIVETEPETYCWRMNLDSLSDNYVPHITNFPIPPASLYNGPTLFITGSKSDFVNPHDHCKIRELFPAVEFVELDAGHWVHADKPNEVLEAASKFLLENKSKDIF